MINQLTKKNLKILQSKNVFKPTGTSDLLYQSVIKSIKKPGKILDLGCGSGYVGISIKKNLKFRAEYYFSDLSKFAANLTKRNLKLNNIKGTVKSGNLFACWSNHKFDFIVNDVSGISKQISKYSPWYNNKIPYNSGHDGTKLTTKFILESKKYLNKNGKIYFPIISLCNYKKVLLIAKKNFKKLKLISSKSWPLPKEMYKYQTQIEKLNKKNIIFIKKKFGMIIFKTDIYSASI